MRTLIAVLATVGGLTGCQTSALPYEPKAACERGSLITDVDTIHVSPDSVSIRYSLRYCGEPKGHPVNR